MKQVTVSFNVEDDFEPGCCYDCPLSYEEYSDYDFGYIRLCALCCSYDKCPIKKENIK